MNNSVRQPEYSAHEALLQNHRLCYCQATLHFHHHFGPRATLDLPAKATNVRHVSEPSAVVGICRPTLSEYHLIQLVEVVHQC